MWTFSSIVAFGYSFLDPFLIAQQPKSCKKGSARVAFDHYDFSSCWTPFLPPNGCNPSKRSLAAYFLGLACRRVLFANCWIPCRSLSSPMSSKRGLAAFTPDLHDQTFRFPAAGPLFVPSAAWILQKGIPRNLTSDLLPFPAAARANT